MVRGGGWVFWAWLGCLSAGRAEILILEREGGAVLVAAQEVVEEKKTVRFREQDGTKREVEAGKVLGKLPETPSAEAELSREQAVTAINLLLEAKARHPSLEQALQGELEIWKARLDKMPSLKDPEALAKAEATFAAAREKAVPQAYEPKRSYTVLELRGQNAALAELAREFPDRADEVERVGSPWRLEEEQQGLGRKKFEGRWLEPGDWEKEKGARQAAAKEAFLGKIQVPAVSPVLFSQGIFVAGLGLIFGGALLGLSFLFHGVAEILRHRAWWKGTAWAVAGMGFFTLMARATVLSVAQPEPALEVGPGEPEGLDNLLWEQAGLGESLPAEVRLTDGEINAWWGRRLKFSAPAVTDILAVSAEGWQIEFEEGEIHLVQGGRWLGQTLVLRHQLVFSRAVKGEDIYRVEASLGKLPLPPALVLRTWHQWVEKLRDQGALFPGGAKVRLQRIEKGAVVLSTD